jgi:(p)ppGpp synthase/HD superfamily hydrolase
VEGVGELGIQTGSTVLDVAFALGREKGLHFKAAYINRSSKPCAMDYVPGYDDRVRIETDPEVMPELGWLVIARMPEVRKELVKYFEEQ